MIALSIIAIYLGGMVLLGFLSATRSRGTSEDFFVTSHTVGPLLMLLSLFATTMTSFALIGSTSESYHTGIGVYGMLASWSGIVHAGVFFFVGIPLWARGKRFGYVTQVQYFRDRFESNLLGWLLFPILVGLVIPYVLMSLLSAGSYLNSITAGTFPEFFKDTRGGIPPALASGAVTLVVLAYIFLGGWRGAAWANAAQTILFMGGAILTYLAIGTKMGGFSEATQRVMEKHPERLVRGEHMSQIHFFSYAFVPLSVGMFPHVFQQWLTAKSAKTFRLTVIAHPIFILLLWLPCVLLGVWGTAAVMPDGSLVIPADHPPNSELGIMIAKLTNKWVAGLISAGILSAIISFDSQFLALGTMFTNDVVVHRFGEKRFNDRQKIWITQGFIVLIVMITYLFSLGEPRQVFKLGVWCFSGFSALFPLVVASLYWKRATTAGAIASILVTAVVWCILFHAGGYGAQKDYLFLGMEPAGPIMACSTLALVAVSLVTQPPSEATIRRFFPR